MHLLLDLWIPLIVVLALCYYLVLKRQSRLEITDYESFARIAKPKFVEMVLYDKSRKEVLSNVLGAPINPHGGWVIEGLWEYSDLYSVYIVVQFDKVYQDTYERTESLLKNVILPTMIERTYRNSKLLKQCELDHFILKGHCDTVQTYYQSFSRVSENINVKLDDFRKLTYNAA